MSPDRPAAGLKMASRSGCAVTGSAQVWAPKMPSTQRMSRARCRIGIDVVGVRRGGRRGHQAQRRPSAAGPGRTGW